MTTIRELCIGDIVAVDTYESGRLLGVVRRINIGAHQGEVSLRLPGGGTRTVIGGNDADAFIWSDDKAAVAALRAEVSA